MSESNEKLEQNLQAVKCLELLQVHGYVTGQTRMRILKMLFNPYDKKENDLLPPDKDAI